VTRVTMPLQPFHVLRMQRDVVKSSISAQCFQALEVICGGKDRERTVSRQDPTTVLQAGSHGENRHHDASGCYYHALKLKSPFAHLTTELLLLSPVSSSVVASSSAPRSIAIGALPLLLATSSCS